MSPSVLDFIGNIGSFLSVLAAVLAAWFAWSAAAAAREAVVSASTSEALKYFREINLAAGRSRNELQSCASIGAETKTALDSHSSLSGMTGNTLITQRKQRIETWLSEAQDAQKNAQSATYNFRQSGSIELDDAVDRLTRVEGNLGTIVRLRDMLLTELQRVESQNDQFSEKVISGK